VKILSTEDIILPEAIPTGWKIAVLTAYGKNLGRRMTFIGPTKIPRMYLKDS
jgi:hypothetical protein